MTPQEKSEQLVNQMWIYAAPNANGSWVNAKQCAIIAVDEIIENNSKITGLLTQDTMRNDWFWQEVKQEIEKL
jgi:hypothetical protein